MSEESVMKYKPGGFLSKIGEGAKEVVGNYVGGIGAPIQKHGVRGVPEAIANASDLLPGKKLMLGQGAAYAPDAEAARFNVKGVPFDSGGQWAGKHLLPGEQVSLRNYIGRMQGDLGFRTPALEMLQRTAGGSPLATGVRQGAVPDGKLIGEGGGAINVSPRMNNMPPDLQDQAYSEFFNNYFNRMR